MSSRCSQYVEVQLEIGHKATPKTKNSVDGHTHDWTVFVRGPENSNIQHFVEKVVFHLHDSFPKPKRVVKDPPYQVSESGYASFELPVEVYFKNKEEPKKISFDYDLYLRLDDAVSHSRREKLTFQNPSNDFKKKLQRAGGVTNESNGTIAKTTTNSEEKPQTQQTSTSNSTNSTTKYTSKASLSGTEAKRSKTSGVIPSKDKSLNNSQNLTTTVSSTSSFVPEKATVPTVPAPNNPNNKQFTDLFGTPIQARASTDSKNKESSLKAKCTAIASKGVKNDSKSLPKNCLKTSYSSPIHKVIESKSSKETKDPKVGPKTKDIPKGKREDITAANASNKSKKKVQTQPQYDSKTYDSNDKKSDIKASKKRRNSTSSNSSVMTTSSFGGTTAESKLRKESQKLGTIKEKENKKESKKQKVSSKDTNSASGVKKQSSTSTKISFSDNNSSTTIEIKSVKKEKTWDKEVKKSSRSKEFKSSEFKAAKDKLNASANTGTGSTPLSANKSKPKPELNSLKSPKINANKHLKGPKEKYSFNNRERSSSPSSGSLTPGAVVLSSPSTHGPINSIAADIESHESLSPPSSDNNSNAFPFEPIRPNRRPNNETKDLFDSDDSDSDQSLKLSPKRTTHSNKAIVSRDSPKVSKNKNEFSKTETNKRKRDPSKESKESNKRLDQSKNDRSLAVGPVVCGVDDSVLLNDLIDMQRKISESTNSDLLQKIVDIIEESGLFSITKTTFDFDLMKLDSKTVRKLQTYFN